MAKDKKAKAIRKAGAKARKPAPKKVAAKPKKKPEKPEPEKIIAALQKEVDKLTGRLDLAVAGFDARTAQLRDLCDAVMVAGTGASRLRDDLNGLKARAKVILQGME